MHGVTAWATIINNFIDSVALWLAPSHAPVANVATASGAFAPVANAAATPGGFGTRPPGLRGCWICASQDCSSRKCKCVCHGCGSKFCPGANPALPRAPCVVQAATPPNPDNVRSALGEKLPDIFFQGLLQRWQAAHPNQAHAGELPEADIYAIEFTIK
jgi:hypothetical protein